MTDEFIVFGAPDIRQDEIDEVIDSMQSGWLGTGPKVQSFEQEFADYFGVDADRVAALNSCTAALHVSLLAAGIGPGDEVITTAMTFCATANAVIHSGATPVIADVLEGSWNIDPADVERRITDRTRAIVPVHFAGRPCEMDAITKIADKHDLQIIEDCAHAIETEYRGQRAGTFGTFGCFSFYVTKNVTTGEGGMVLANSTSAVERIKVLSLHGMTKDAWRRYSDEGYKHYRVVEAGFKYNMMDLQAAIGIHQLRRVEEAWQRRRALWAGYQDAFRDLPVGLPLEPDEDTRHGYHLYTLTVDAGRCGVTRDEFLGRMQSAGVGVGVHYLSLADHPLYQDRFGWRAADYPVAAGFGDQTVSLPLSPRLSDADAARIVDTVRAVLSE